MSSPIVERVRTVPLIVEQGHRNNPMEVEEISGFPFDRDSDREGHFRSQLDDIAKRHPEFAEHLGNFTLRNSPRRQSSLGGADEPDLQRRFQRPFGGNRFERFGFPFDRDDFDPEEYTQQFYQPQQEFHQQQPTYHQQQSSFNQPQPEYHQTDQQQCSQSQDTERSPPIPDRSNIHQSNTVDLGQKQEPVNERSQRSMSAPPPEKGQRFTSSINIPVNQPNEGENMSHTQPQQQAETKAERIIPIHIEGRSEPVIPKTAPPTYTNSPQPEVIFGQRPENFTQFLNRDPPRQYEKWHPHFDHGYNPEEFARTQRFPQQQTAPPHYQQQQKPPTQQQQQPKQQPTPQHQEHAKDEIPIPVQVEVPHTKQQVPQQQQQQQQTPPQPKPAQQQKKPLTPLDQIQAIQNDVSVLLSQVERFAGKPKDKQYLYLDEMLTRNLLKLDNVDTQGQDSIRSARKEAIKGIEKAIALLEANAAANAGISKQEENMEIVEDKPQDVAVVAAAEPVENVKKDEALSMETEQPESQCNKSEDEQKPHQEQPMELVPETPANTEAGSQVEQKEESQPSTEEHKVEEKLESSTAIPAPAPPAPAVAPAPVENNMEAQVVENKETVENKPSAVQELTMETCANQENNLPVNEAVKKFEGNIDKVEQKKDECGENKKESEENEESSQNKESGEAKAEEKKGEKKEKKKIKKKVEKKEK